MVWYIAILLVVVVVTLIVKNKKVSNNQSENIDGSVEDIQNVNNVNKDVNKVRTIILIFLITNCITLLCVTLLLIVPLFQSDKNGFGALLGAEDVPYFGILCAGEEEFAGSLRVKWNNYINENYNGFGADSLTFTITGFIGVVAMFLGLVFSFKRVVWYLINYLTHTRQNVNFKAKSFVYIRGAVCKTHAGCIIVNSLQVVIYIAATYCITVFPLSFAEYYEGLMVLSGWFWILLIVGFGSLIGGLIAVTIYSCKNRKELVDIIYN